MTAMVESSIVINNNSRRLFRLTAIHRHIFQNINDNQRRKITMSSIVANNAVDVSSSDENDVYASSSSSSPNDRKRSRPYASCQSLLSVTLAHTDSNTNNDNSKKKLRRNDTSSTSRRLSVNNSRRVTFNDVRSSRSALHSLSEDDQKDLWYSLEDCAAMDESMKREVQAFRFNNIDKVRHMICVSSQCSYSKPNKAFLDMVRLDLPDECRGLERTLLPPRQNRENNLEHVRKVVEAQQMMKEWFRMGQKEQQNQKQTASIETKNKEGEAEMTKAPKNAEEGGKVFRRKNNNHNKRAGKKQRKSPSSSASRRMVMGNCSSSSSSKLDLVIAARARKSSQSSRLFAQLLGREVATSVKTEVDHIA